MNAKDFLKKYGTPDKEILTTTDSEQLVVLAGLDEHDYVVHNELYLNAGLDPHIGFLMRFDGVKDLNPTQKAETLLGGDEPMLMCVTVKRNFGNDMKMVRLLLSFLPAWSTLDVVLLKSADVALGEGSRTLLKALGMNPPKIIKSERSVSSIGMGTKIFPCSFRVTSTSNQSGKFPTMKTVKLLEKGRSPKDLVLEEPEMPANVFVVQSHVSWTADLYIFLNATKDSVDEVPRSDPKSTKYAFAGFTKELLFNLVDKSGGNLDLRLCPFLGTRAHVLTRNQLYMSYSRKKSIGPCLPRICLALCYPCFGNMVRSSLTPQQLYNRYLTTK